MKEINESPISALLKLALASGMKLALRNTDIERLVCSVSGEEKPMALVLKGGEFIATEALSASALSGLMSLARRQPLLINGLELRHQDLATLAEEAQRTGQPVWPQIPKSNPAC